MDRSQQTYQLHPDAVAVLSAALVRNIAIRDDPPGSEVGIKPCDFDEALAAGMIHRSYAEQLAATLVIETMPFRDAPRSPVKVSDHGLARLRASGVRTAE